MNVKFKILKQMYPKNGDQTGTFRIFRCMTDDVNPKTRDGFFSLKGDLSYMNVNSTYNMALNLEEENQWGFTYGVDDDVEIKTTELSHDEQRSVLESITTKNQTDYIMRDFPDFVNYVLDGRKDEIPIAKIYNVGEYKRDLYASEIIDKYQSIVMQKSLSEWKLTIQEVKTLMSLYQTKENIEDQLTENPYEVFCGVLGRDFDDVDKFIVYKISAFEHSQERCEWCVIDILKANELDGNTKILANKMAKYVKNELLDILVDTVKKSEKIHYDEDSKTCAMESTYQQELNIAKKIKNIIKNNRNLNLNIPTEYNLPLTEEQKKILQIVSENSVCLLMGNAGSGKSTTTKAIVDMLEDNNKSFRLVAPTGIAAKRLSQCTGHRATTIHSACLSNPMTFDEDIILIDEFSMVSLEVMSMLCARLTDYHRLIFVCDSAQLPSITCGNVLKDIVDSGIVPSVVLTKVFRFGIGKIATVTTNIRNGVQYIDSNGKELFKAVESDYEFNQIKKRPLEQILEKYDELIEKYDRNDIMILSPYNKGSFGSRAINNAIQDKYNPSKEQYGYSIGKDPVVFRENDRVINIKNNYHALTEEEWVYNQNVNYMIKTDSLPVDFVRKTFPDAIIMNGDIGCVDWVDTKQQAVCVKFDNVKIVYESSTIRQLLLAYAISVHKSQGTESKAVIVITHPQHINMLNRNLLYVATSRAKEYLVEIGDAETINSAIKEEVTEQRITNLKEMLLNGTI